MLKLQVLSLAFVAACASGRTQPGANARFVEYERSGHYPYLDEPDRFASEVSAFILGR